MNANWFKYLPGFLCAKLEGRHNLQKIISNTGWLFIDKILRAVALLLVGVWVARYLGPEQFGKYNYSLAFAALFAALASLGLDGIVVRDIAKDPTRRDEILGTAFALKLISGVIVFCLAMISIYLMRPGDKLTQCLVAIFSAGTIFQAFDVIDFWFQSQVQSKFTVYAKNGSFLIFSAVKVGLILLAMPLVAFAWVGLAEVATSSAGLVMVYRRLGNTFSSWVASLATARRLLQEAWPLMFSALSYLVYMRIDQVMIGSMLNDHAVGIYSAATRISETLLALFLLLSSSCFPAFTKLYACDKTSFWTRYHQVTYLYTLVAVALLVGVLLFGRGAMGFIFGRNFSESYDILKIQIFGLIFMANAGLRSTYLTISSNQRFLLATTVFSAIANIFMNYFLIPIYHASGAALATALTQMISLFILNVFFDGTRKMFFIQMKALFFIPPKGTFWKRQVQI